MNWWHRLWRGTQMEDQLDRELGFHLDQHAAELIAQGVAPTEAHRRAQLELGGREQVKERCRDARGTRWLDDLFQDVRYALRTLRRRPGVAVVALLTLGLGSGATTVIFTVINGVLLKPLPYADPGGLLKVDEQTKAITDYRWGDRWAFSYPNFLDCQHDARSLRMAAFRYSGGTLSGSVDPEYVDGLQVSSNLLSLLSVTPVIGRTFTAEEYRAGAARVIIISHALWQRRFGGNPSALGAPVVFDGTSYAVVARTLLRLSSVDPGVNVDNVLTSRMALSPAILGDPARIRSAWLEVLERAHRVPGVRAVAMVDTVPMRSGNNQLGYWTAPPEPPRMQKPLALANSVTPEYLDAMGIPLRRGRFFDDHDRLGSERVVVIDEVLAQHAFAGQDPMGRRLWTDLVTDPLVVVGVVGHVRYWGLAGDDQAQVRDQFYYPFAQVPDAYLRRWSELMSIAVRTGVEPLAVVDVLRHELRGAAGDQVLYEMRTLKQLASATLARQRFLVVLFGAFAALALLLACIGIYGVLAYLTGQRVPEFGVRIALGATNRDVMRLVLGESVTMIAVGAAMGGCGAWAAGRVLQRLVEGVRATELSTVAATTVILVLAALVASFVPARRASCVDAMTALRQE